MEEKRTHPCWFEAGVVVVARGGYSVDWRVMAGVVRIRELICIEEGNCGIDRTLVESGIGICAVVLIAETEMTGGTETTNGIEITEGIETTATIDDTELETKLSCNALETIAVCVCVAQV